MKLPHLLWLALCLAGSSIASPVPEVLEERQAPPPQGNKHLRPVLEKRQKFEQGQPISADGKGGPILGMNEPPHRSRTNRRNGLHWVQVEPIKLSTSRTPIISVRKAETMEWSPI